MLGEGSMSLCKASGLGIFAALCLLAGITGSAHAQCDSFGTTCATEWSGGGAINLGSLSGSTDSAAYGINDAGQVVGYSVVAGLGIFATEWSDGSFINLGRLPGSSGSLAYGINDAGQVVGYSIVGETDIATEWSDGSVINLGRLPGSTSSFAYGINDVGEAVGYNEVAVPEPSTWAMMLVGFGGLAFAGYRRANARHAMVARHVG
jgi:probable HAF family extracellular repeat protein